MFTMLGYSESVDCAAAYNAITACADQHLTVSGNFVRVPTLNKIIAVAGYAEAAVAPRARLVSPSLRRKTLLMISPLHTATAAAVVNLPTPHVMDLRDYPVSLATGENLSLEIYGDGAAAQIQSGVVLLADGTPAKVTGEINTVRATNASTLVASSWTNGALTFDEDLPRGRYAVVGMRAHSAGLIAARLVFSGGMWRPGCCGNILISDIQHDMFRMGNLGVWGEFEDSEPPTVDFLSVSGDTAQVVYLDLIQLSSQSPQ